MFNGQRDNHRIDMSNEYSLAIAFRLDRTRFESDYDQRYAELKATLSEFAIGGAWDDTTSLVLMKTHADPHKVAKALTIGLHRSHDVLLVHIVGRDFGYLFGDAANEAELTVMSGMKIERV